MPTITLHGFKTIRKIINTDTDNSILNLEHLIQSGRIVPSMYTIARLDYESADSFNKFSHYELIDLSDYYPLKFISADERDEIWVSCVSSGNLNASTFNTIKALKMMGFNLAGNREEEIFTTENAHFEFMK